MSTKSKLKQSRGNGNRKRSNVAALHVINKKRTFASRKNVINTKKKPRKPKYDWKKNCKKIHNMLAIR